MGERNKHIENLRKGNRSSFEYLYTVWSGKLYNFVMKISHGDSYLAEEMVQTVFLKVWKNREQLDPKLSFVQVRRRDAVQRPRRPGGER